MAKIKIAIVDDHPMVRNGLSAMLNTQKDMEVQSQFVSGLQCFEVSKARLKVADVIVMDIRMPDLNDIETLRKLKRVFPDVRVLLMAGMPLKEEEDTARAEGAYGYLPKTVSQPMLLDAIRKIHAAKSRIFIAEEYADSVSPLLTPREMQVLSAASKGFIRDEIAAQLNVSSATVKGYLKSIMIKLDAANTTNAVSRAYELGILRP